MSTLASPDPRRDLARNLFVDVALPWIVVQGLEGIWHVPTVPAFAIAAMIPLAAVVYAWTRKRRIDVIGIAVAVTIVGGIALSLLTDDVRFALVRAAPGFALFGAACLVSLAAETPLMFYVARQFNTGGDAERARAFTDRLSIESFRRAMRIITTVWGVACLVEALAGVGAAFVLRPELALVVEPVLGLGTVALLLSWTFRFARRASRPGQAPRQ
jgi:hypothetical protein